VLKFQIIKNDPKSHKLQLYSIHEIFQTLFTLELIRNKTQTIKLIKLNLSLTN